MTYHEFKENLIRAFPPTPFTGVITNKCDCSECDALRQILPGKRWDEIPNEFIDFNSSSLCLMEPETLKAFLPAWLLRSMETISDESVLSELTTYFLCPSSGNYDLVKLFDSAQRQVVHDYLVAISTAPGWDEPPVAGMKWWGPD